MSAATEQVEEKAEKTVEATEGTEADDKVADETKAAVEEPVKKKPKKAAIEGC